MRIGRRWRLRLLALGALGLVFAIIAVFLPPNHPIDRATFDKIQSGMTRGEVEDLLGGRGLATAPGRVEGESKTAWAGSEGGCVVYFDADGRVTGKNYSDKKTTGAERAAMRVSVRFREWTAMWK